uniref:Protein kinase domain-containing protein n=1 Tax=Panagrolaimus sp. PS1159 TaxID=55785 RepID=A0AC35F802_9BILA
MNNFFIIIFFITLFPFIFSQCPSIGIRSYVLFTITPETDYDGFLELFDFYAKISSTCGIEIQHDFRFGKTGFKRTITTNNLTSDLLAPKLPDLYQLSLTDSTSVKKPEDDPDLLGLATVIRSFRNDIDDRNTHPDSFIMKKSITIITDYLNENLTDTVPGTLSQENAQAFIITPLHNASDIFDSDKFKICVNDVVALDQCSMDFCKDLTISIGKSAVPNTQPDLSKIKIFAATFHPDLWMLRTIATEIAKGDRNIYPQETIKLDYIKVHFAKADDEGSSILLPWLGNVTQIFYEKCINTTLIDTLKLTNFSIVENNEISRAKFQPPELPCSNSVFYKRLLADLSNTKLSNGSVIILGDKCPNCLKEILNSRLSIEPELQIFFRIESASEKNDIYSTFINPVHNRLNQSLTKFHATFIEKPIDIINATTVNKMITPYTPLVFAKRYTYREPWSLAIDQFIVIIVLCIITAIGVGAVLYHITKKIYIEQMAEAQEEYKETKICLKPEENLRNDCLPWEVHIDRITLHQDFPLGEDNNYIIYLGKLKGKAPICQWINLPEMKQFQDCAVAVRVPRRYDDEEERQLLREINAMKILKHHDYISNLLGWFNKHNFACTIMELTHTNLLKYASQIKDSCEFEAEASTMCVLPLKQYLRIFVQVTDAMGYVAAKGLVHRNLTAKNVLLTTGLRAKISGFNYCSIVGDPDFEPTKPSFYNLPIHWMSIEAMKGRFTDRSDVWSYTIMSKCWVRYPERRPTFKELQTEFQRILDRQYEKYDNPAFVFEHPE